MRNSQRGAAILMAMLIVAMAVAAAVALVQQQDLALRHLSTAREYEQAVWILKGGTQWARSILAQDARITAVDHGAELWATGLPVTEIEQGSVGGEIIDRQGLFNLNNLVLEEQPSARDVEAFKRLLGQLGMKEGLANAIVDWIDRDQQALPDGGAEDDYYLRLAQPYRAANQPLAEMGELLRVRGMDAALLAQLRRYATALPRRTAINVNLAPPEVLVAYVPGLTLAEAQAMASARRKTPYREMKDFRERVPRRELKWDEGALTVESQYFLVRGQVTVGRASVRMEALLERGQSRMPDIVWQRMQ